jgi:hypothetical protein
MFLKCLLYSSIRKFLNNNISRQIYNSIDNNFGETNNILFFTLLNFFIKLVKTVLFESRIDSNYDSKTIVRSSFTYICFFWCTFLSVIF